ncbi:MAG: conjugal transfer protein TrbJ [Rhodomicrobium sp.]
MNKRLNSRILAAAAALAFLPAGSAGARAQAVVCTNCSTEVTQLLNLARLIDQLGTQQNILTTGTNQFQTMTVNTTPYASLSWSNGTANLASVNALLSSPSLLGLGTSQTGTYNSYLSTQPTSSEFAAKYQQWSTNTNSSVLTALQAGQQQASQITGDEASALNNLKAQTQGVQGNLQALQTIAQTNIMIIEQLQKLRQLTLTDMSLKAQAIQTEADKDASTQAAWSSFLTTNSTVPTN